MGKIILASASPRRRELLEQIGIRFEVIPARGDECVMKEKPEEIVMELAARKAKEVAVEVQKTQDSAYIQKTMVIGADTIVACPQEGKAGMKILGKPGDHKGAFSMLSMLAGRTHFVYTGVSVVMIDVSGEKRAHTFFEKTLVTMRAMEEREIRRYIGTGEPADKAGAYGIQGKCAIYIDKIDGDYNNVVGLPVAALYRELKKAGIDLYEWQEEEDVR